MFIYYLLSFFLGSCGAFFVWRHAHFLGLIDKPCERSSHNSPTPKGGGIGIFVAFLLSAFITGLPISFWLPISIISFMALLGDRVEISVIARLIVQFALIAFVVFSGNGKAGHYEPFYMVVMFLWTLYIVGTANYYNFMDGINGMAGISGVIGYGLLAVHVCINDGPYHVQVVSVCIAFSCLGFLPFNLPDAKVFMGDIGSIFLGLLFALLIWLSADHLLDFICMASFIFPVYADELITFYVRIRNGENPTSPHRKHIYQILANEAGFAHWRVSFGFGALQLFVGIGVLCLRNFGITSVLLFLVGCFCTFALLGWKVRDKFGLRNG